MCVCVLGRGYRWIPREISSVKSTTPVWPETSSQVTTVTLSHRQVRELGFTAEKDYRAIVAINTFLVVMLDTVKRAPLGTNISSRHRLVKRFPLSTLTWRQCHYCDTQLGQRQLGHWGVHIRQCQSLSCGIHNPVNFDLHDQSQTDLDKKGDVNFPVTHEERLKKEILIRLTKEILFRLKKEILIRLRRICL